MNIASGSDEGSVSRADMLTVLAVATWLWALMCAPIVTDAGPEFCAAVFLFPVGLALGTSWAATTAGLLWYGVAREDRARAVASWTLTLFAFLVVGVSLGTGVALAARTALCERQLLRAASAATPGGISAGEGWVGLYYVRQIEREGRAVAFVTAEGLLDRYGLLYLPPGSSPPGSWRVRGHLFGNWYRGYWRF